MKNNDSAVLSTVKQFLNGYARQDTESCMRVISTSVPVVFFGTNLDEVFRDADSIRAALIRDFGSISDIHFGEYQQLIVHAENSLASLIVELPISFKATEDKQQCIFRYAFNLRKEENDVWKIYSCMVCVPFSSGSLAFDEN